MKSESAFRNAVATLTLCSVAFFCFSPFVYQALLKELSLTIKPCLEGHLAECLSACGREIVLVIALPLLIVPIVLFSKAAHTFIWSSGESQSRTYWSTFFLLGAYFLFSGVFISAFFAAVYFLFPKLIQESLLYRSDGDLGEILEYSYLFLVAMILVVSLGFLNILLVFRQKSFLKGPSDS